MKIAIIMCAGKGSRMKSDLAKVLHTINGMPMICKVIDSVINICDHIILMVGDNEMEIKHTLNLYYMTDQFTFIKQPEALGTGHCIQCAMPCLEQMCCENICSQIVILSGDMPLISDNTIKKLMNSNNSILVAFKSNPFGYGRIVMDKTHAEYVYNIYEEKDCTEELAKIQIVNCGVYCFEYSTLLNSIFKICNDNANHEYYLPDIIKFERWKIKPVYLSNDKIYESIGVNTQDDLLIANESDMSLKVSNGW